MEQLPLLLRDVRFEESDLSTLRHRLLLEHRNRGGKESGRRKALNAAYEQTEKEIADLFSQRKVAEHLGILPEIDKRLAELRDKRDLLQAQLNASHENGSEWIEKLIRSFELIELLQEAIFCGSLRTREAVLKAVASNFSVDGRKLVWKPRTPFRQVERRGDRPKWLPE